MKSGPMDEERLALGAAGDAVFVVCEGNFMYGNASLDCYIPSEKRIENNVFARANAIDLGDVAQSMTIFGGRGYVVINNSGIIFIVDPATCRVTGAVTGLGSPRYILPVSASKAYVTDLYAASIAIVNPATGRVTGHIATPDHPSTEQMAQWGGRVFVSCWSYDDKILAIDTTTDTIAGEIEVGRQPSSLVVDRNGKLWVLTGGSEGGSGQSGAFEGEAPALWCIDAATMTVEQRLNFAPGDSPSRLCLNGSGDTIYYLDTHSNGGSNSSSGGGVWRMDVADRSLPATPVITPDPAERTLFYALGVDPRTSEIYVGDAIDYNQPGVVYRYSAEGALSDKFRVGIIPGSFCFR